jgi:hypothetical protein
MPPDSLRRDGQVHFGRTSIIPSGIKGEGEILSERFSCKPVFKPLLLSFLLLGVSGLSFAQKPIETIDATARGTSTQMGKEFNIKVLIYSWSTDEDRQTLKAAFEKGQSDGLSKALQKMNPVGRIQVPGKVGYDLGYVQMFRTDTAVRSVSLQNVGSLSVKPTRTLGARVTT